MHIIFSFFLAIRGINVHGMPEDLLAANFNHWLGFECYFFGDAVA